MNTFETLWSGCELLTECYDPHGHYFSAYRARIQYGTVTTHWCDLHQRDDYNPQVAFSFPTWAQGYLIYVIYVICVIYKV